MNQDPRVGCGSSDWMNGGGFGDRRRTRLIAPFRRCCPQPKKKSKGRNDLLCARVPRLPVSGLTFKGTAE